MQTWRRLAGIVMLMLLMAGCSPGGGTGPTVPSAVDNQGIEKTLNALAQAMLDSDAETAAGYYLIPYTERMSADDIDPAQIPPIGTKEDLGGVTCIFLNKHEDRSDEPCTIVLADNDVELKIHSRSGLLAVFRNSLSFLVDDSTEVKDVVWTRLETSPERDGTALVLVRWIIESSWDDVLDEEYELLVRYTMERRSGVWVIKESRLLEQDWRIL